MKLIMRALSGWSLALVLALPALAVDPIRIGVVDELTGPQAEAGVLVMRGIKLATDEVNAAGGIMGHPIELKVEDNASTNPGTVLAYSRWWAKAIWSPSSAHCAARKCRPRHQP